MKHLSTRLPLGVWLRVSLRMVGIWPPFVLDHEYGKRIGTVERTQEKVELDASAYVAVEANKIIEGIESSRCRKIIVKYEAKTPCRKFFMILLYPLGYVLFVANLRMQGLRIVYCASTLVVSIFLSP